MSVVNFLQKLFSELYIHMRLLYLLISILIFTSHNEVRSQSPRIINSEISFTIKNTGINVNGIIGGFEGTINFNPIDLSNSKIICSVDPATIDTGINSRDKHLKGEDYFDVKNFKSITIESISLKKLDNNEFEGKFNLTIKGTTKLETFKFNRTQVGEEHLYQSEFIINRRDYNVGGNSLVLSDEVKVAVKIITQ